MKKIIIVLVVVIFTRILCSTVLFLWTDEEIESFVQDKVKLSKTHCDSLLQSTIEFSKEEYMVGNTIDITIHFKVDTKKNKGNIKFAIIDYGLKTLYKSVRTKQPEKVTQRHLDDYRNNTRGCYRSARFVESDPDLILTNENPTGDYHLKFELVRKNYGTEFYGKRYPYEDIELRIEAFTKSRKYKFITIYEGSSSLLTTYIKLHPSAIKIKLTPEQRKKKREEQRKKERQKYIDERNEKVLTRNLDKWGFVKLNTLYKYEPTLLYPDGKRFSRLFIDVSDLFQVAYRAEEELDYYFAESIYKTIIENYPYHHLAEKSASALQHIEAITDENYHELQKYYNEIIASSSNDRLANACDYCSNYCNILMEEFIPAINWYEDRILNPISWLDSIYAVIDLNHTYLLLDQNQRETLINSELCFDPLTHDNFNEQEDKLINLLMRDSTTNYVYNTKKPIFHIRYSYPSNSESTIIFSVPKDSYVELFVYNFRNEKVRTLVNDTLDRGNHSAVWDSKDDSNKLLESGVYVYIFKVNGITHEMRKCIILKED